MILSAEEAKKRAVMVASSSSSPSRATVTKTQLERSGAPTFTVIVELLARDRWRILRDVAGAVDALLQNQQPVVEERWLRNGKMFAKLYRLPYDQHGSSDADQ